MTGGSVGGCYMSATVTAQHEQGWRGTDVQLRKQEKRQTRERLGEWVGRGKPSPVRKEINPEGLLPPFVEMLRESHDGS